SFPGPTLLLFPLPPASNQLSCLQYSFEIDQNRESNLYFNDEENGCKPEQQMMYAGSKNNLVQTAELTKVFEIRNTEDLTEEWLCEKLGFFH
uniref:Glia maturation factor beta n=1 Tax=Vombatus ursinus TaxID=29139 RepID=A0A4X2KHG9_VOMUR